MNVRMFLDRYPVLYTDLYTDLPKRTVEDAIKDGDNLCFLKTDTGWMAANSKTGCIFRNKKESSDK
jgi:hypothetical protein